jgi:hypothetical protein
MNKTDAQSEYATANELVRHFATVLLTERTLFVAVTGALITVLFSQEHLHHPAPRIAIELLGLASAFVFLVAQETNAFSHFHCMKRAASLEADLDYKIWSSLPGSPQFRIRPGTWAVRAFFILVIIFWIVALCLGERLTPPKSKDQKAATTRQPFSVLERSG